nr:MAG TPA: hypothetical protein [Caudoviricetes sp.]
MLAPFDFGTKKGRNCSHEQLRFLLILISFQFVRVSDGGRNDPLSVAVPP